MVGPDDSEGPTLMILYLEDISLDCPLNLHGNIKITGPNSTIIPVLVSSAILNN